MGQWQHPAGVMVQWQHPAGDRLLNPTFVPSSDSRIACMYYGRAIRECPTGVKRFYVGFASSILHSFHVGAIRFLAHTVGDFLSIIMTKNAFSGRFDNMR